MASRAPLHRGSGEGSHAGVPSPREHQLANHSHADHLVVQEIRRHANQRQIAAALPNHFMARRIRNEVGETFETDRIAVSDMFCDCF